MTPATKRSPRTVAGTDATASCLALGLVVPFTVDARAGRLRRLLPDRRRVGVGHPCTGRAERGASWRSQRSWRRGWTGWIDRAGRNSVNPRLLALLADESDMLGNLDGLDAKTASRTAGPVRRRRFAYVQKLAAASGTVIARTAHGCWRWRGQSFGARAVATFLAGDGDTRKLTALALPLRSAPQVVKDVDQKKAAPALFCTACRWWVNPGWSFNG